MMDSNKASTSTTNSSKTNCDNEKNKNYKSGSKQLEQGDNDEKLFTSNLNSSPNFVPLNGSRSRLANVAAHDSCSQSSKSIQSPADSYKNLPSTTNSSTSRLLCNDSLAGSATACSSRSSLNTNNGLESEGPSCQRHRVCMAGGSNTPSTSATTREDNIVAKENRKRPASLKFNRPDLDDDSSTDTGNDDYSLGSEDGCIYTYRGGEHLADLPSSFFSLDMGLPLDRHLPMPPNYAVAQGAGNAREGGSRASSPDMDFLEMDFDPGPSCEVDSGEVSSEGELDADLNMQEENDPVVNPAREASPEHFAPPSRPNPVPAVPHMGAQGDDVYSNAVPSTSRGAVSSQGDTQEQPKHTWYGPYITHTNHRGEQLMVRRTMTHCTEPVTMHPSSGHVMPLRETTSTEEEYPEGSMGQRLDWKQSTSEGSVVPAPLYHLAMADKQEGDSNSSSVRRKGAGGCEGGLSSSGGCEGGPSPSGGCEGPPSSSGGCEGGAWCAEVARCMLWSEREASERHLTQPALAASGPTALHHLFNALGVPVSIERITASVSSRPRADTAPIPRYLLSCVVEGCTAAELVAGVHRASDGLVAARFFPTYPERAMSLSHWLADWMALGAVPILTQYLQAGSEGEGGEGACAWHHQMVWGVSPRGVFLCNPVECVHEGALWARLAAPSVLAVRARDVAARFTAGVELAALLHVPDARWHALNVPGQVAHVLREWQAAGWHEAGTRARRVLLPAACCAGVTLAAPAGSEALRRLAAAPPPPLLRTPPASSCSNNALNK